MNRLCYIALLLLLLNCFSRVQLCATPETAAYQAPPSLGFSNTGVGCHFLPQCRKVKSESEVAQSCLTLHDPMDCSLPGSSVHGILQAGTLEWAAIFLLQCMKVKSESEVAQSCLTLHDPKDCNLPGSSVHGIFQARDWSGLPLPSPAPSEEREQNL